MLPMADKRSIAAMRTVAPMAERERALAAARALFGGRGYWKTSEDQLRLAMSMAGCEIERHFASKDQCFAAIFDDAVGAAEAELAESRGADWEERVRHGVATLLERMSADPRTARIVLVESQGNPVTGVRMAELVTRAERFLRKGRGKGPERAAGLECGLVGGILFVLQGRLMREEAPSVRRLEGELAHILLESYGAKGVRAQYGLRFPNERLRLIPAPARSGGDAGLGVRDGEQPRRPGG